jgi:hypothetical protein
VILIAGGIVVWLYFARPNYDPLGLVWLPGASLFGLEAVLFGIGLLVDEH